MPRTVLAVQVIVQNLVAVNAGDLAVTFASDPAVGNSFPLSLSLNETLLVWNQDSAAHNFRAISVPDHIGRTSDVVYSVPAGTIAAFEYSVLEGWKQADGSAYVNTSHSLLKFAVLRQA